MGKQASITRKIASKLRDSGWAVAYICIPNTVHIGVVPIPTPFGSSKQRYPDIVAFKDQKLRLIEVEMSLSESVCNDIILRFSDMREALNSQEVFERWRLSIERECSLRVPKKTEIECHLSIVDERKVLNQALVDRLERNFIAVRLGSSL